MKLLLSFTLGSPILKQNTLEIVVSKMESFEDVLLSKVELLERVTEVEQSWRSLEMRFLKKSVRPGYLKGYSWTCYSYPATKVGKHCRKRLKNLLPCTTSSAEKIAENLGVDGEKGRKEERVGLGIIKHEQRNKTIFVKYFSGFRLNIFIFTFLLMER